jgi:hypothetical protein
MASKDARRWTLYRAVKAMSDDPAAKSERRQVKTR